MERIQPEVTSCEGAYYRWQKRELTRNGSAAALATIRGMEDEIIRSNGRPSGSYCPGPILEFASHDQNAYETFEVLMKNGHTIEEMETAIYNTRIYVRGNIAIVYWMSDRHSEASKIIFSFVQIGNHALMDGFDERVRVGKAIQIHRNNDRSKDVLI